MSDREVRFNVTAAEYESLKDMKHSQGVTKKQLILQALGLYKSYLLGQVKVTWNEQDREAKNAEETKEVSGPVGPPADGVPPADNWKCFSG